eukprot:GEMP01075069.1.p1 GENE.GEMP01075069.1~~GEMP01075069.1.p1  ORF type:complete len:278 (+),score=63.37 GEMP01075069.1:224-1057(+)
MRWCWARCCCASSCARGESCCNTLRGPNSESSTKNGRQVDFPTVPNALDNVQLNFDELRTKKNANNLLVEHSVRAFARTLSNGMMLDVVSDEGMIIPTTISMDFEMLSVTLTAQALKRTIMLEHIEAVLSVAEMDHWGIRTSNNGYLTDNCATLVIKNEMFLSFKFDTLRLREYFQTCLQALVVARTGSGSKLASKHPSDGSKSRSTETSAGNQIVIVQSTPCATRTTTFPNGVVGDTMSATGSLATNIVSLKDLSTRSADSANKGDFFSISSRVSS